MLKKKIWYRNVAVRLGNMVQELKNAERTLTFIRIVIAQVQGLSECKLK